MPTAEKIRDLIHEALSLADSDQKLGYDDDLLGVLDSLQVLRLVMDLETQYSMKVDNSDMTPENLGSIAKLAAFIDSKR